MLSFIIIHRCFLLWFENDQIKILYKVSRLIVFLSFVVLFICRPSEDLSIPITISFLIFDSIMISLILLQFFNYDCSIHFRWLIYNSVGSILYDDAILFRISEMGDIQLWDNCTGMRSTSLWFHRQTSSFTFLQSTDMGRRIHSNWWIWVHVCSIHASRVRRNNCYLFYPTGDGCTVRIFDLSHDQVVNTLYGHLDVCLCCCFRPGKNELYWSMLLIWTIW